MPETISNPIAPLLEIMRRLRDPNGGCAWDLEQNFATIAPYTIEEAYEVAEAIAQNDMNELREELGDLLLQVVFHSQMAAEAGHFSFADVANGISDKMIRRHPHVFGEADIRTSEEQTAAWEVQKAAERAGKAKDTSALAGVAAALPALMRAQKLGKRAARTGFDWPDTKGVIAKIREELDELEAAIESGDAAHQQEEVGDTLFAVVNLARHLDVDAEDALRGTNAKFERRFRAVEAGLASEGITPEQASLEQMEHWWNQAKHNEKNSA
jgi:MazG family protein